MKNRDKCLGSFRGLGIGDAMGAPVEFKARGTFEKVIEFQKSLRFGLKEGQWTDDTIMAFCLAESLIKDRGYNSYTVMNTYLQWYDNGYNSPNGSLFDIGLQTATALRGYKKNKNEKVLKTASAGNGVLMRLAPAVISTMNISECQAAQVLETSARDTHNSIEAAEATVLFGLILRNLINGENIEKSLENAKNSTNKYILKNGYQPTYIAERTYNFTDKEAENGGYIIPSLGTALWALKTAENFEYAILKVVNLGRDSDTVAAITGQLTGAYYGDSNIPEKWKQEVHRSNDFEILTDNLMGINKGLIYSRIYEK